MKVWTTLTPEQIREVAQSVGVTLFAEPVKNGRAWNFRLALNTAERRNRNAKYQRTSSSGWHEGRRVNAVCWHGHRDFMRAVFAIDPNTRFKTALADWRGQQDFEDRFAQTAYNNVGSMMYPMFAKDCCTCSHDDWDVDSTPGGSYAVTMQTGMIRGCDHVIFTPDHYRADGSCKCDEKDNADMKEWGYTWDEEKGRWGNPYTEVTA